MRKDQIQEEKKMRGGWQQSRNQTGFSLVEVMVIVVIIGLLIVFAAPDFSKWRPNLNLKSAADDFYAHMQKAKLTAIKKNLDVTLNITAAGTCPGGSYFLVDADGEVTANVTDADLIDLGVCLEEAHFDSGDAGYNARGLPLDTSESNNVTFTHSDGDYTYIIVQTAAGGLTRQKN